MQKKPFKSKSSYKKTLIIGYISSCLLLFMGYMELSEFNSKGYIFFSRGFGANIVAEGGDAVMQIYGLMIGGFVILTYSIYLTIRYGNLLALTEYQLPEIDTTINDIVYICIECGESFFHSEVNSLDCKKCSGDLENAKGFFDRHPGFFSKLNKSKVDNK